MSPEWFYRRLTFRDASDFITGMERRYRNAWEQSRMVADVVAKVAGNKGGTGLVFPWEEEERAERRAAPTEEELEEMKKYIKK